MIKIKLTALIIASSTHLVAVGNAVINGICYQHIQLVELSDGECVAVFTGVDHISSDGTLYFRNSNAPPLTEADRNNIADAMASKYRLLTTR